MVNINDFDEDVRKHLIDLLTNYNDVVLIINYLTKIHNLSKKDIYNELSNSRVVMTIKISKTKDLLNLSSNQLKTYYAESQKIPISLKYFKR